MYIDIYLAKKLKIINFLLIFHTNKPIINITDKIAL